MAGYAFGCNPPYELSWRSGNRPDIASMMDAA
jgi:hypothetical protein